MGEWSRKEYKGVKFLVIEGNLILGGEHIIFKIASVHFFINVLEILSV